MAGLRKHFNFRYWLSDFLFYVLGTITLLFNAYYGEKCQTKNTWQIFL